MAIFAPVCPCHWDMNPLAPLSPSDPRSRASVSVTALLLKLASHVVSVAFAAGVATIFANV